jgi:glycosyltransferase involved in cell wall biosynthesis
VFPLNPLAATVRKGEVKDRYFNPSSYFGAVLIVDPGSQVANEAVASTVGSARLEIVGSEWSNRLSWRRFGRLSAFLDDELERLMPRLQTFGPDATRGYGPQISGWLAVRASQRLGVPSVISLHADYDRDVRALLLQDGNYRRWLANLMLDRVVERETVAHATVVICAYRFLIPYAQRRAARRIEVIYNRVDTRRFAPHAPPVGPFSVLTVGRLDPDKDPSNIIRAMTRVDGRLMVVGDGVLGPRLRELTRSLGLEAHVEFRPVVPHARVHEVYASAHVYATAYRLGGVAIPVLEAMASGLPVVAARSQWEPDPEIVGEVGLPVDNDPAAFAEALERLRGDPSLRTSLAERGRRRALDLDGAKMEEREAALYRELIGDRTNPA